MSVERKNFSGYLQCPLCDAEVPISEDDKAGDQLFCPYCQSPLRVREKAEEIYLADDC